MSTTEKQDPFLRAQDRAGGGAGHNSKPHRSRISLPERSDGGAGDLALWASQEVSRALWETEGWQKAGQPTVEGNCGVQFVEGDEEVEEDEDEDEDEDDEDWSYYEDEEESEDYEWEEEEDESDDVEDELDDVEDEDEDMELDKEEGGKDSDGNMEEEESGDSEEEEEDDEEEVCNIREVPMVQFRSVFWGLIHSLLYGARYNDHDLAQPNRSRKVGRSRSELPLDLGESSVSWEPDSLGEGPVPREREDPEKKADVWKGKNPAEGTSWMLQEPAEGTIYQKTEEEVTEAHGQKCKPLVGASESWEAGACASDGAKTSAYGKWLPIPLTLAAPDDGSCSKAGGTQHLPSVVKRRVHALKRLQAQCAKIDAQFYKDIYDLEKRYAAFYQPLFDKRSEIINAVYEPTEDECQWEAGVQEGAGGEKEIDPEGKEGTTGIPHFWLKAFKSLKILDRLIWKKDELVLEHLKDVKIKFPRVQETMSFTVEFVFKANEYFFNEVLTKTYWMTSDPDDSDPFLSEGPKIINSTGCMIYWKEGKDITVKSIKLQKYESHGIVTTIKQVPRKSFFTYFYSSSSPEGRGLDVATDYKLGYIFREVLVPKPLLFYIKEACRHKCEKYDDEAQEDRGKEEKKEGIRNEKPEKDLDPENSSF